MEWIELTTPPPALALVPAPGIASPRAEARSAATASIAIIAPPTESPAIAEDAAVRPPAGGRSLLDHVGAGARAVAGRSELPKRDPLERGFRVPGRAEAFVEGFHVRAEVSFQDRIHQIGALIGGGRYDPCPDIASRLRDARSDT
ncbi:MAG: hypothetical protein MEQ07_06110 [Aquimonas sp.]|nr:hypothetical protein [Aquimonas sp.]